MAFPGNLTAFYAKASVFNGSGNVANGNGTIQLTGFGSLTNQNGRKAFQRFSQFVCFFQQFGIAGGQFSLLSFICSQIGFSCAQSFLYGSR